MRDGIDRVETLVNGRCMLTGYREEPAELYRVGIAFAAGICLRFQ